MYMYLYMYMYMYIMYVPWTFFTLAGLLRRSGMQWSSNVTVSSRRARLRTLSWSMGEMSVVCVMPRLSGMTVNR